MTLMKNEVATEKNDVKDASESKQKREHNMTSMKNEVLIEKTDVKDASESKRKREHNMTSMKNEVPTEGTNVQDARDMKRKTEYNMMSMKNEAKNTNINDASETKQKREDNITSTNNESAREQNDAKNASESFPLSSSTNPKIKYTARKNQICPAKFQKKILSIAQEEEVYPWKKEAAKNRLSKSPLSNTTRKIIGAHKLLEPVMKSQLYQSIEYPDHIAKNIGKKIETQGDNYFCINCVNNPPFSTNRRNTAIRHVKTELGYYRYRCSFCDEISNDPRTLVKHYASTHGIPSNWLQSN